MRLGTLLMRDGLIRLDHIEAALRAQVVGGGRIGTHLVELGHISLDVLGESLGRLLGVPGTTEAMVAGAAPDAVGAVPVGVAAEHRGCPLRFVHGQEGRALEAAFVDPSDDGAAGAFAAAARAPVRRRVAPELLVERALERHYGLARRPRTGRARARTADPMPRPIRLEPASGAPTSLTEAMGRIARGGDPDSLARTVVQYARGRVETAVFFRVEAMRAVGWLGFAPGVVESAVPRLSFALDQPSSLSVALLSRAPRRGAPRGRLDPEISVALGALRSPEEILAAPLLIGGRPLALLWVHARETARLDDDLVEALTALLTQ